MKIFTALLVATSGWPGAGRLVRAEAQTLSQEQVIATVLAENVALTSARAKWMAMRERVPQAKAWDDPMAGVDLERVGSPSLARVRHRTTSRLNAATQRADESEILKLTLTGPLRIESSMTKDIPRKLRY